MLARLTTRDRPTVNWWSGVRVSKRDSSSRGVFFHRGADDGRVRPGGQGRRPGPPRLELLDRTVDARYRLREAGRQGRTERCGENFRRGPAGGRRAGGCATGGRSMKKPDDG